MPPPPDRYRAVYAILFLQGVGALLPWNVFITAASYFGERLKDTSVHASFLNWFSLTFNLTTLFVVSLNAAWLRPHLPCPRTKVVASLVGIAVVLLITAVLVQCSAVVGSPFFAITISSIVVASICSAYLQEGLFEITALLPEIYTQAVMTGQSMAGFLVALSGFVLTWLHPILPSTAVSAYFMWSAVHEGEAATSAFIYFLVAFATVLAAWASMLIFFRLPFTKFFLSTSEKRRGRLANQNNDRLVSLLEDEDSSTSTDSAPFLDPIDDEMDDVATVKASLPRSNPWKILWQVRHFAFTVFATFFVTLALFPVVTSSIESTSMNQSLFVALTFVVFNLGDVVGRACTALYVFPFRRLLAVGAVGRVAFFVLFFVCNVRDSPITIFRQDGAAVLVLFACAWSNGYFCSVAMMRSTHAVHRANRELCSSIMFLCLCLGLTAGSLASFGLRALLCRCNPF
ncbi:hypothetical protein H310_03949 [Aphanomyces invadans]|uniref:Nucleoside transporter n=1 Tax=Aphanomyces invadans TaxID=157072 RepID=A0A024UG18_9STRA|nr:hypothetical protein H310_03949 [Aphanomyces invadans]ETW04822.1 hypothetical protein H310_03949 [Aphanomyces invadans]RHY32060.1 hypothetical protein DYB32_002899 [Aphanomyces invadans]|eukprot:XP_008866260.1 hypothetical protein H310_03949 [Aphanomyces invadans]